jgi:hypothetical protein
MLKWRPLPDSNRNRRFRKPELYPVELRGRETILNELTYELKLDNQFIKNVMEPAS